MVPQGIPFPMLSDAGGKLGNICGVYNEDIGVNTRGRFIIDPDGVVQAYEILLYPAEYSSKTHYYLSFPL